jgi:hypothetical protein
VVAVAGCPAAPRSVRCLLGAIQAPRDGVGVEPDHRCPAERALTGHANSVVNAVACTVLDGQPDAITAADDGTVRIWDLREGRPQATFAVPGSVGRLGLSGGGEIPVGSTGRLRSSALTSKLTAGAVGYGKQCRHARLCLARCITSRERAGVVARPQGAMGHRGDPRGPGRRRACGLGRLKFRPPGAMYTRPALAGGTFA